MDILNKMHSYTIYLLLIWMISDSEAARGRKLQSPQAAHTNQQAAPTNQQAARPNQQDAQTSQQEFAVISEEAIRNVSNELRIWKCFRNAKDKAKRIGGDANHQAAITWISMYSRYCKIPSERLTPDQDPKNFPFRLNKELRCTNDTRRDARIRSIFVRVGDMIDKALDVLSPQTYRTLYRGMEYFQYTNSSDFVEDAFFSTSRNISVALAFAKGNILFIIAQMKGVYIANYVQEQFEYQKEVLPKRQTMFRIEGKISDKNKIKEVLKENGSTSDSYIKQIIYITQNMASPSVVSATSYRQQYQSIDYCTPKFK